MKKPSPATKIARWVRQLRAGASSGSGTPRPPASLRDNPDRDGQSPAVIPGDQPILKHPLTIFDLETSGLDMQRDTVLSIGAVRIENNAIPLTSHIDNVLQVDTRLKRDSQLLHGLSQEDLQHGMPAGVALRGLLAYGKDSIWMAFHAGFDRRMLDRALRHHLDIGFDQTLFDVAALAPMLFPEYDTQAAGLDHWAQVFGLSTSARHTAAADAFLTAEITLVLLNQAHRKGLQTWGQLASALRQWEQRRLTPAGPMF